MLDLVILTLCSTLLFGLLLYQLLQNFFSAPYVPSSVKQVKPILDEYVKPGTRFIDLGSGDGGIVFAAASLGAEAHGIDTNPLLTTFSKLRNTGKRNKAKFHTGDMFRHDLKTYDVIYTYLFPEMLEKLSPKFKAELKPGTVIVSHSFEIPNKLAERIVNRVIYIYRY